jgi:arylsulfatase A
VRAPTDHPNIVLINCDDLGYGDLGCYGSTVHATPALDRMAAEGTRLTDFYMASSVCSPSRGAMMTGCYPPRIGLGSGDNDSFVLFPGHHTGIGPDEITIADVLRAEGYATQIIGKWHLGDQPEFLPTRHGFDGYYGLPYSNDMSRQQGCQQQWCPLPLMRDQEVIQQQPDQSGITERYVEESVRFIRAHRQEPFFLYFAHMYVHLPHYPPRAFLERSRNGPYGAVVECIDWSVSALLHELRIQGLEENTLVIFTSDNGGRASEGGSNAPLRGSKFSSWEGGFRVPCIARWPGQIPAGAACAQVTTSMDFMPTLARLAGTREPDDRAIDGCDISPVLLHPDNAISPRSFFLYYFRNDLDAVRAGRWKLFVRRFSRDDRQSHPVRELFDLGVDIGETTNVCDQHPDVVAELMQHIEWGHRELGCQACGISGQCVRPSGYVEHPQMLTEYDPQHPYYMAEYDLADRG